MALCNSNPKNQNHQKVFIHTWHQQSSKINEALWYGRQLTLPLYLSKRLICKLCIRQRKNKRIETRDTERWVHAPNDHICSRCLRVMIQLCCIIITVFIFHHNRCTLLMALMHLLNGVKAIYEGKCCFISFYTKSQCYTLQQYL